MSTSGIPDAPLRPDEARAHRRRERRWLPLVGVLTVIALVTLGGRAIGAVSASEATVGFDGIVRLHPAPGWTERAHSEGDGRHQLLMTHGAVGLYVVAIEDWPSTAADVAQEYARSLSSELAQFVPGGPSTVVLSSGRQAVRFGFVGVTSDGVPIDGIVTSMVTDRSVALVFEARAQRGDLGWAAADIDRMIDGAEVA